MGKLVQVERDLEIGRQIQKGFLPEELPHAPGWEVAALFRPAREVSGDFYDAFALSKDHLALVIADVCDKGGLIVTFLALLEMIRLQLVRVFQAGSFGPIRVYKRPRPADAPHPIGDPESGR